MLLVRTVSRPSALEHFAIGWTHPMAGRWSSSFESGALCDWMDTPNRKALQAARVRSRHDGRVAFIADVLASTTDISSGLIAGHEGRGEATMVNAAREPSGSGLAAPFDIPPIEEHLRALATSSDLPEAALRSCVARIQQARPALLAIIDAAADDAEMGDEEAYLLFRGLYVLGAARDTAAFKPLLRLLHVSPDTLDDLLGDATTTDLVRIAASVFDGDVDALLDATTDLSIDEFARHSLLQAATFLTWDGRISHDRMRGFVRRVAEEKLLPPEDTAWHAWADTISRLGWRELAPLVEQAFACGDFPVHVMEYSDFEEDLAKTEGAPADGSRFEDDGLGYLGDVVEALAWTRPQDASTERPGRSLPDAWRDVDVPYVNPMRNVGRNDPCPCGSGKKAKKCCLAD